MLFQSSGSQNIGTAMLFLEALGQDSATPLCLFGNHWLVGLSLQTWSSLLDGRQMASRSLLGYIPVTLLKKEWKSFLWNQVPRLLGWKTDWINSSAPSLNYSVFLTGQSMKSNGTLLQELYLQGSDTESLRVQINMC